MHLYIKLVAHLLSGAPGAGGCGRGPRALAAARAASSSSAAVMPAAHGRVDIA